LRKEYRELFIHGAFEVVDFENLETFCFVKCREEKRALVALNFTSSPQPLTQADLAEEMKLLVSNYPSSELGTLQPYEGRVYIS
jgi:alpha-glucosidase